MADRIRISPVELETQANKLYTLGSQVDDITLKAGKAMRLIEEALSSKFTSNMEKKSATLMKNIRSLRDSLYIGSKVAFQCASSYKNADTVLRDEIGNSLPQDVISSPTSDQKVEKTIESSIPYSQLANKNSVGSVVANTGNSCYDNYRVAHSSYNGGDLECVGYVNGRFKELTGHTLNIGGNAIDYQYNHVNDGAVYYTTNINEIKLPAIAVTRGYYTNFGHVVIIENVDCDAKGNITQIYFTEGNSRGANGALKVKSYSEFFAEGQSYKPYGFISLK